MKKLLILVFLLLGLLWSQNIQDDSILRINYMQTEMKIFDVPDGYSTIREGGNVLDHNGQLIWVGTCYDEDAVRKYSLHYWVCDYAQHGDLTKWDYKGKIKIVDNYGKEIDGEDPNLWFEHGIFHIQFENKSYEKKYKKHHISYAKGTNKISGTFLIYSADGLAPYDEWLAVYSPHSAHGRSDHLYYGGRKIAEKPSTEWPSVAKWYNNKWNPLPEPLIDGYDYGFQSCDFGSDIWQVKDKYVAIGGGLRGWTPENAYREPFEFYFASGVMQGETLTTGWRFTKEEIRAENNKLMHFYFFYLYGVGWKAIAVNPDGKKAYISTIVTDNSEPKPDPDPIPDPIPDSLPTEFTVLPAYPNPFNPSVTIRYGLENDNHAIVQIYDISGKLISTLVNEEQSQGWYSVIWNGTNQRGELVPAGIYFNKITSGNEVKTNKLMLLK